MLYFDDTMLLMIPALLLGMYAQWKVSSAMQQGSQIRSNRGMTGLAVARALLDYHGLNHVRIEETGSGDHYDPMSKTVRLSPNVYQSTSLTALGVAAHEVGHAVQHSTSYAPLQLRSGFFPLARLGSMAYVPILLIGMLMASPMLINTAILLLSVTVLFQVITLPVEYNASARAMQMLRQHGYIGSSEERGVKNVLDAAALTYVAAAVSAIMSLLRIILISRRGRRR